MPFNDDRFIVDVSEYGADDFIHDTSLYSQDDLIHDEKVLAPIRHVRYPRPRRPRESGRTKYKRVRSAFNPDMINQDYVVDNNNYGNDYLYGLADEHGNVNNSQNVLTPEEIEAAKRAKMAKSYYRWTKKNGNVITENPLEMFDHRASNDSWEAESSRHRQDTGLLERGINNVADAWHSAGDFLFGKDGERKPTMEVHNGHLVDSNWDFNDDKVENLRDEIMSEEDDYNADKVFYYKRVVTPDGGTAYKAGVMSVDAYTRDLLNKGSGRNAGEYLFVKRTDRADEFERRVHGNSNFMDNRLYAMGDEQAKKALGTGYTEIYGEDLFGIDGTVSREKLLSINEGYRHKLQRLSGIKVQSGDDAYGLHLANEEARKIKDIYGENSEEYKEIKMAIAAAEQDRDHSGDFEHLGLVGSVVDEGQALLSGAGQVVTGVADAALDAILPGESTLLNNAKSAEYWDSLTGYEGRKETNFDAYKAIEDFQDGNYGSAIANAAAGAVDFLAQSLPEMVAMTAGGPAGFAAVVAKHTNDVLDERERNNNGEDSSIFDAAAVAAGQTALLMLDKISFKGTLGSSLGREELSAIKELARRSDPSSRAEIAKKLADISGKSVAVGVKESAQEFAQEGGEAYMGMVGTDRKGENALDKAIYQGTIGAVAGLGAGAVMKGSLDARNLYNEETQAREDAVQADKIISESDKNLDTTKTEYVYDENGNGMLSEDGSAATKETVTNILDIDKETLTSKSYEELNTLYDTVEAELNRITDDSKHLTNKSSKLPAHAQELNNKLIEIAEVRLEQLKNYKKDVEAGNSQDGVTVEEVEAGIQVSENNLAKLKSRDLSDGLDATLESASKSEDTKHITGLAAHIEQNIDDFREGYLVNSKGDKIAVESLPDNQKAAINKAVTSMVIEDARVGMKNSKFESEDDVTTYVDNAITEAESKYGKSINDESKSAIKEYLNKTLTEVYKKTKVDNIVKSFEFDESKGVGAALDAVESYMNDLVDKGKVEKDSEEYTKAINTLIAKYEKLDTVDDAVRVLEESRNNVKTSKGGIHSAVRDLANSIIKEELNLVSKDDFIENNRGEDASIRTLDNLIKIFNNADKISDEHTSKMAKNLKSVIDASGILNRLVNMQKQTSSSGEEVDVGALKDSITVAGAKEKALRDALTAINKAARILSYSTDVSKVSGMTSDYEQRVSNLRRRLNEEKVDPKSIRAHIEDDMYEMLTILEAMKALQKGDVETTAVLKQKNVINNYMVSVAKELKSNFGEKGNRVLGTDNKGNMYSLWGSNGIFRKVREKYGIRGESTYSKKESNPVESASISDLLSVGNDTNSERTAKQANNIKQVHRVIRYIANSVAVNGNTDELISILRSNKPTGIKIKEIAKLMPTKTNADKGEKVIGILNHFKAAVLVNLYEGNNINPNSRSVKAVITLMEDKASVPNATKNVNESLDREIAVLTDKGIDLSGTDISDQIKGDVSFGLGKAANTKGAKANRHRQIEGIIRDTENIRNTAKTHNAFVKAVKNDDADKDSKFDEYWNSLKKQYTPNYSKRVYEIPNVSEGSSTTNRITVLEAYEEYVKKGIKDIPEYIVDAYEKHQRIEALFKNKELKKKTKEWLENTINGNDGKYYSHNTNTIINDREVIGKFLAEQAREHLKNKDNDIGAFDLSKAVKLANEEKAEGEADITIDSYITNNLNIDEEAKELAGSLNTYKPSGGSANASAINPYIALITGFIGAREVEQVKIDNYAELKKARHKGAVTAFADELFNAGESAGDVIDTLNKYLNFTASEKSTLKATPKAATLINLLESNKGLYNKFTKAIMKVSSKHAFTGPVKEAKSENITTAYTSFKTVSVATLLIDNMVTKNEGFKKLLADNGYPIEYQKGDKGWYRKLPKNDKGEPIPDTLEYTLELYDKSIEALDAIIREGKVGKDLFNSLLKARDNLLLEKSLAATGRDMLPEKAREYGGARALRRQLGYVVLNSTNYKTFRRKMSSIDAQNTLFKRADEALKVAKGADKGKATIKSLFNAFNKENSSMRKLVVEYGEKSLKYQEKVAEKYPDEFKKNKLDKIEKLRALLEDKSNDALFKFFIHSDIMDYLYSKQLPHEEVGNLRDSVKVELYNAVFKGKGLLTDKVGRDDNGITEEHINMVKWKNKDPNNPRTLNKYHYNRIDNTGKIVSYANRKYMNYLKGAITLSSESEAVEQVEKNINDVSEIYHRETIISIGNGNVKVRGNVGDISAFVSTLRTLRDLTDEQLAFVSGSKKVDGLKETITKLLDTNKDISKKDISNLVDLATKFLENSHEVTTRSKKYDTSIAVKEAKKGLNLKDNHGTIGTVLIGTLGQVKKALDNDSVVADDIAGVIRGKANKGVVVVKAEEGDPSTDVDEPNAATPLTIEEMKKNAENESKKNDESEENDESKKNDESEENATNDTEATDDTEDKIDSILSDILTPALPASSENTTVEVKEGTSAEVVDKLLDRSRGSTDSHPFNTTYTLSEEFKTETITKAIEEKTKNKAIADVIAQYLKYVGIETTDKVNNEAKELMKEAQSHIDNASKHTNLNISKFEAVVAVITDRVASLKESSENDVKFAILPTENIHADKDHRKKMLKILVDSMVALNSPVLVKVGEGKKSTSNKTTYYQLKNRAIGTINENTGSMVTAKNTFYALIKNPIIAFKLHSNYITAVTTISGRMAEAASSDAAKKKFNDFMMYEDGFGDDEEYITVADFANLPASSIENDIAKIVDGLRLKPETAKTFSTNIGNVKFEDVEDNVNLPLSAVFLSYVEQFVYNPVAGNVGNDQANNTRVIAQPFEREHTGTTPVTIVFNYNTNANKKEDIRKIGNMLDGIDEDFQPEYMKLEHINGPKSTNPIGQKSKYPTLKKDNGDISETMRNTRFTINEVGYNGIAIGVAKFMEADRNSGKTLLTLLKEHPDLAVAHLAAALGADLNVQLKLRPNAKKVNENSNDSNNKPNIIGDIAGILGVSKGSPELSKIIGGQQLYRKSAEYLLPFVEEMAKLDEIVKRERKDVVSKYTTEEYYRKLAETVAKDLLIVPQYNHGNNVRSNNKHFQNDKVLARFIVTATHEVNPEDGSVKEKNIVDKSKWNDKDKVKQVQFSIYTGIMLAFGEDGDKVSESTAKIEGSHILNEYKKSAELLKDHEADTKTVADTISSIINYSTHSVRDDNMWGELEELNELLGEKIFDKEAFGDSTNPKEYIQHALLSNDLTKAISIGITVDGVTASRTLSNTLLSEAHEATSGFNVIKDIINNGWHNSEDLSLDVTGMFTKFKGKFPSHYTTEVDGRNSAAAYSKAEFPSSYLSPAEHAVLGYSSNDTREILAGIYNKNIKAIRDRAKDKLRDLTGLKDEELDEKLKEMYPEKSADTISTVDVYEIPGFYDLYETAIVDMYKSKDSYAMALRKKKVPGIDGNGKITDIKAIKDYFKTHSDVEFVDNAIGLLSIIDLEERFGGPLYTEDGGVSKMGRKLMKDPVMTFFYLRGIRGLRSSMANFISSTNSEHSSDIEGLIKSKIDSLIKTFNDKGSTDTEFKTQVQDSNILSNLIKFVKDEKNSKDGEDKIKAHAVTISKDSKNSDKADKFAYTEYIPSIIGINTLETNYSGTSAGASMRMFAEFWSSALLTKEALKKFGGNLRNNITSIVEGIDENVTSSGIFPKFSGIRPISCAGNTQTSIKVAIDYTAFSVMKNNGDINASKTSESNKNNTEMDLAEYIGDALNKNTKYSSTASAPAAVYTRPVTYEVKAVKSSAGPGIAVIEIHAKDATDIQKAIGLLGLKGAVTTQVFDAMLTSMAFGHEAGTAGNMAFVENVLGNNIHGRFDTTMKNLIVPAITMGSKKLGLELYRSIYGKNPSIMNAFSNSYRNLIENGSAESIYKILNNNERIELNDEAKKAIEALVKTVKDNKNFVKYLKTAIIGAKDVTSNSILDIAKTYLEDAFSEDTELNYENAAEYYVATILYAVDHYNKANINKFLSFAGNSGNVDVTKAQNDIFKTAHFNKINDLRSALTGKGRNGSVTRTVKLKVGQFGVMEDHEAEIPFNFDINPTKTTIGKDINDSTTEKSVRNNLKADEDYEANLNTSINEFGNYSGRPVIKDAAKVVLAASKHTPFDEELLDELSEVIGDDLVVEFYDRIDGGKANLGEFSAGHNALGETTSPINPKIKLIRSSSNTTLQTEAEVLNHELAHYLSFAYFRASRHTKARFGLEHTLLTNVINEIKRLVELGEVTAEDIIPDGKNTPENLELAQAIINGMLTDNMEAKEEMLANYVANKQFRDAINSKMDLDNNEDIADELLHGSLMYKLISGVIKTIKSILHIKSNKKRDRDYHAEVITALKTMNGVVKTRHMSNIVEANKKLINGLDTAMDKVTSSVENMASRAFGFIPVIPVSVEGVEVIKDEFVALAERTLKSNLSPKAYSDFVAMLRNPQTMVGAWRRGIYGSIDNTNVDYYKEASTFDDDRRTARENINSKITLRLGFLSPSSRKSISNAIENGSMKIASFAVLLDGKDYKGNTKQVMDAITDSKTAAKAIEELIDDVVVDDYLGGIAAAVNINYDRSNKKQFFEDIQTAAKHGGYSSMKAFLGSNFVPRASVMDDSSLEYNAYTAVVKNKDILSAISNVIDLYADAVSGKLDMTDLQNVVADINANRDKEEALDSFSNLLDLANTGYSKFDMGTTPFYESNVVTHKVVHADNVKEYRESGWEVIKTVDGLDDHVIIYDTLNRKMMTGAIGYKTNMSINGKVTVFDEEGKYDLPVRMDIHGKLYKELELSEHDKSIMYKRNDDGLAYLVKMAKDQSDVEKSKEQNEILAEKLANDYAKSKDSDKFKEQFINIADPKNVKFRDLHKRLSKGFLDKYSEIVGSKKFDPNKELYIRVELANALLGAESPSMLLEFTFNKLFKGESRRKIAMRVAKFEKVIGSIVIALKDFLTIRNPAIWLMNAIGSFVILTTYYSPATAFTTYLESFKDVVAINLLRNKYHSITDNTAENRAKRASILRKIKSNPAYEIYEMGFSNRISEDLDFNSESDFLDKAKNKVDRVIGKKATKVIDEIMFNRGSFMHGLGTTIFTAGDTAARLADLRLRGSEHDHMLKKKLKEVEKKYEGEGGRVLRKKKQEALKEYVNVGNDHLFKTLSERYITYGEHYDGKTAYLDRMGINIFYKYKHHIQRVILRMAKDNPSMFAVMMASYMLLDPFDGKHYDHIKGFLSHSLPVADFGDLTSYSGLSHPSYVIDKFTSVGGLGML